MSNERFKAEEYYANHSQTLLVMVLFSDLDRIYLRRIYENIMMNLIYVDVYYVYIIIF